MKNQKTDTTSRKGRPALTNSQMEEMRIKITNAAQTLFVTEGYAAISIRRLAAEVGCSPMTIYKYFDSKVDILRHLWSLIFMDVFTKIEKICLSEIDPVRRLNSMSLAYVTYWLDHSDHYRMVFMSEGVSQPEVSVFVEDENIATGLNTLFQALFLALPEQNNAQSAKVKADLFLCNLIGISHALITISGYSWSEPREIVALAVKGILAK